MATANIQFSCPQCQKKFSTPGSLAGKTVRCGCGAQVTVPSPQSPSTGVPQVAGAPRQSSNATPTSSPSPTPQLTHQPQYQPQQQPTYSGSQQSPTTTTAQSGGYGTGGSGVARRDFPALKYVAKCIDSIAWLILVITIITIVLGVLAGIANALNAGAERGALIAGVLVAGLIGFLFISLLVVFIRASAELIRLALYMAELLEDIRSNTG